MHPRFPNLGRGESAGPRAQPHHLHLGLGLGLGLSVGVRAAWLGARMARARARAARFKWGGWLEWLGFCLGPPGVGWPASAPVLPALELEPHEEGIVEGDAPEHLGRQGEAHGRGDFGPLLHLRHLRLVPHRVRVQEVAPEHQSAARREHRVHPAPGDHQSFAGMEFESCEGSGRQEVGQKGARVKGEVLIGPKNRRGGWGQEKNLGALEEVIPDRGAAEVEVKVRVRPRRTHEAVLLHLGPPRRTAPRALVQVHGGANRRSR
mmetsp:Transcript_34285/g.77490  ORF Transcript_34285/g.77490 Transcript_34285/m.77490 type:complete len:263 (+) Transcript_34285:920-1708(+)